MSGRCSAARAKGANAPHRRQACVGKHRGSTLQVRNDRFALDVSGVRPRRWKCEFLSIGGVPIARRKRCVDQRGKGEIVQR